jgi:hypothetical protein
VSAESPQRVAPPQRAQASWACAPSLGLTRFPDYRKLFAGRTRVIWRRLAGGLLFAELPSLTGAASTQKKFGELANYYNSHRSAGAKSCRERRLFRYSDPYSPKNGLAAPKCAHTKIPGAAAEQPGTHLCVRHQLVTSYESTAYASDRCSTTPAKSVELSAKDAIGAKMSDKRGSCL